MHLGGVKISLTKKNNCYINLNKILKKKKYLQFYLFLFIYREPVFGRDCTRLLTSADSQAALAQGHVCETLWERNDPVNMQTQQGDYQSAKNNIGSAFLTSECVRP